VSSRTEATSTHGVVSGGHPAEAVGGVRILEAGGNAIDAVVAAAFIGFVVEPASCGVGGYGHLAAFIADDESFVAVDHSPRIPAAATADMFEIDAEAPPLYYGWPATRGRRNEWGHLSVAVPGAVAGLCATHERWGRLPLADVLQPAIEAAERGVDVTWDLVLNVNERLQQTRSNPGAARLLLRDGDLPKPAGWLGARDVIDTSPLATTLRRIATDGAAGFHDGPVAIAVADEVQRGGGILTVEDLVAYVPRIMVEDARALGEYTYTTGFDQLGYETLNLLEELGLASHEPGSLAHVHLLAEAMAAAFADTNHHWGDPDQVESPLEGLASRAYAAERAKAISLDVAMSRPVAPGDPWPFDGGRSSVRPLPFTGTSQMTAADVDGNVVALITSLTHAFGSSVLVPSTGVFLNNSMVNFDPRPGLPNSIAPGKTPVFAAPALVARRPDGTVFGACGSGGYRILSGVVHTTVNALLHQMSLQAAVDAPRVHCQGGQTFADLRLEDGVRQGLRGLGHDLVEVTDSPGVLNFGRISAVMGSPAAGFTAGAGPAWSTASAGASRL